jgi:hypothetical protein
MTDWPQAYLSLPFSRLQVGDYYLQTIQWEDRIPIRVWRNAQIDFLRQSHNLTEVEQDDYFEAVVLPQLCHEEPRQILFGFFCSETLIGYGGLVHISWPHDRGEVSFLLDPARASDENYPVDFNAFLGLIVEVAFVHLGFHRITTETIVERTEHLAILEASKFVLEGRLVGHRKTDSGYADSVLHARISSATA